MNSTKKKVCLSKHCIGASNRIFEYMDDEIDPCDDFNKFACGGFEKKSIIPDDQSSEWVSFYISAQLCTAS